MKNLNTFLQAKKIGLALLAILTLCGLLMTGCATNGTNGTIGTNAVQLDPGLAGIISSAVQVGTRYAVERDQNAAAYLQSALSLIRLSLDMGDYDAAKLGAALQTISVKELRSPAVRDTILFALRLYEFEWQKAVAARMGIDRVAYLRSILRAICDGIAAGLADPATTMVAPDSCELAPRLCARPYLRRPDGYSHFARQSRMELWSLEA
jgi:hypothetical protein